MRDFQEKEINLVYETEDIKLICGDTFEVLEKFPDGIVDNMLWWKDGFC